MSGDVLNVLTKIAMVMLGGSIGSLCGTGCASGRPIPGNPVPVGYFTGKPDGAVVDESGRFLGMISDRNLLSAFSHHGPGIWEYLGG
jgi:hypothetical protein